MIRLGYDKNVHQKCHKFGHKIHHKVTHQIWSGKRWFLFHQKYHKIDHITKYGDSLKKLKNNATKFGETPKLLLKSSPKASQNSVTYYTIYSSPKTLNFLYGCEGYFLLLRTGCLWKEGEINLQMICRKFTFSQFTLFSPYIYSTSSHIRHSLSLPGWGGIWGWLDN